MIAVSPVAVGSPPRQPTIPTPEQVPIPASDIQAAASTAEQQTEQQAQASPTHPAGRLIETR